MNASKPALEKIGPGYRVGSLVVEQDSGKRKGGYVVWACRCDCGGTILLDTRALQRGTIRDCGCKTKFKPGQKDITGQRFGRLVAWEPSDMHDAYGSTIWRCRCDCGNTVLVPIGQLTSGMKKSCGCLGHPPLKEFVGKRFGRLTVISYAGKRSGMHRWRCLCDCGNVTVVGQTLLQSGKTRSCGCLKSEVVLENMKFLEGTSVTSLEHAQTRLISTNTSGVNGVYLNKKTGKWIAQIGFRGKCYHLGSFSSIQEATVARKEAENKLYGPFLEWYYENHPQKGRISDK